MFNKTQSARVVRYVAAFGLATLAIGAAQAEEVASVAKSTVSYADLDLSKESDAKALYVRLQHASKDVCGEFHDLRNLKLKRLHDACYEDTLARAVDAVGHAKVSALFATDERFQVASRASKAQATS